MPEPADHFLTALRTHGLHAGLAVLNGRTPHRFTGAYRFDGDTLRNIALFDRWNPEIRRGEDAPIHQTFCAIVPSQGSGMEVVDGRSDERFPWMRENAVVCYCGALLRDQEGRPWGTVCHFDLRPCEAASSQLRELLELAPYIYRAAALEAGL